MYEAGTDLFSSMHRDDRASPVGMSQEVMASPYADYDKTFFAERGNDGSSRDSWKLRHAFKSTL